MKLSTRLVLLVLGCLLPILTVQVYSQVNLYAERHEQLGGLVLRQASLANADMSSIVDAARQVGALAGQFPEIHGNGPACDERLTALRNSLTEYRFLALLAPAGGGVLCASAGTPAGLDPGRDNWPGRLAGAAGVTVGTLVSGAESYLPLAVPVPGAEPRVLLAGLNVDWLAKHLKSVKVDQAPSIARASLIIADRQGTILARVPDAGDWGGQKLPEWLKPAEPDKPRAWKPLPTRTDEPT